MDHSIFKMETKHDKIIHICEIQENDAWGICDFVVSNESRLRPFFPKTLAQNLTPDLSKTFTQLKCKEFKNKDEYLFTLKEENSKRIIGLIYVKELKKVEKQGELAYCIDYNFEGLGIISQVVSTMVTYTFQNLNLNHLQILVHKTNLGSVRVAEKAGFVWQQTLIENYNPTGRNAMDMELYEHYKN